MSSSLRGLAVVPLPNESLAYTNSVYINQNEFAKLDKENPESNVYVELGRYIFNLKGNPKVPAKSVALNNLQRMAAKISKIDKLNMQIFPPSQVEVSKLLSVSLNVEIGKKAANVPDLMELSDKKLEEIFRKSMFKHFINKSESILIDYEGSSLILKVTEFSVVESTLDKSIIKTMGEFDKETIFHFHIDDKSVGKAKIKSENLKEADLFKCDFNFEKLGIGGLDAESSTIFRRAFNTRRYPPAIIQKYGIKHVKGMLLYGPPGTGKTLIARKIAEVLKAHEPKLVNGPEIFSKFVGESEKNIRELFADAEKEEKDAGEDSKLHIIIFDEIDAICKPRGSANSGVAVHDTVVNQILSKLDGVESLNNILVIGMTNRKDMIDEAVLRPGRLEVHVEIGLPDEPGRVQIFRIHTRAMENCKLLESDVNINELGKLTKNYSGAEIEGVVRSAATFALSEGLNMANIQPIKDIKSMFKKVGMKHFMKALEEVKPQFGIDTNELGSGIRNGIIDFGPEFAKVFSMGKLFINQVRSSPNTPLFSVLIEGPKGCGKTAFSSMLGLESKFPFVKLITPENYIGYSDQGKVYEINKVFNDSYRSPLSIIILDDIERLIEYIHVGPRFSNSVLQSLLVLAKKLPPNKDRKLLVIGTTSMANTLKELGVMDSFNMVITLPTIKSPSEAMKILKKYNATDEEKNKISKLVSNIPIKYMLLTLEMAVQKGKGKLISTLFQQCLNDIMKTENN